MYLFIAEWPLEVDAALVTEYGVRKEDFDGNVQRQDTLFQSIANALQKQKVNVSGEECQNRFAVLQAKFREEFEATQETGAAPSA